jgi:hypothetical protein
MAIDACNDLRFVMFAGDTRILNFLVENENGDNVTIDDASASIFAILEREGVTEILRLDLDEGITLAGNVVTVTIPKDAAGLVAGEYIFELALTDAEGGEHTLAQGTATVKRTYIT